MRTIFSVVLNCVVMIAMQRAFAQTDEMVLLPSGNYVPLYAAEKKPVEIQSFYLDKYPVTNQQFYEFVISHAEWAKENAKLVFAEENYLSHWKNIFIQLTNVDFANAPVTNISWFAAKSYCACLGKQLPTTDEWEYAAMASESKANGSSDSSYYQFILDWYSKPSPKQLPQVGATVKNFYGIYDLHGLVWEWTLDFNSTLMTGDSRNSDESMNAMFCGAAAAGATSIKNYAAFQRFAFRSSLQANYAVLNLGFRCSKKSETP